MGEAHERCDHYHSVFKVQYWWKPAQGYVGLMAGDPDSLSQGEIAKYLWPCF